MKTYLLGAYYIGLTVFVFMGVPYLCFRLYKRYESRPVLARWLYTLMPVLILVSLSWVLRFAGYNNGGVQTLPEARPEPKGTETLPSTAPTPQPTAPRPEQPSPPAPKPARPAPKPAAPAPAPPVVSVAPAPPILPQQPHEHPSQIRRFPWPPPAPSAMVQLPIETFRSRSTYGQLAEELDLALNANGYIERSYYGVGDASDNATDS